MLRLPAMSRSTLITFGGMLVGIMGLIIQWIADPSKFSEAGGTFGIPFPPGILFIVGFGLLSLLTARWWWHPVFAVLIAFWIVGAGSMADKLQPNLVSDNDGTVAGTVIMAVGLIVAFSAGLVSMFTARRARKSTRNHPSTI
ncbi:hypothetical protein [Streptomyces sp. NPDC048665]|uniref:hypothetical protein n=1 Tax=Streptomyces sp. NPDC048665 TaxID=3155490 RepID=UPI00342C809F